MGIKVLRINFTIIELLVVIVIIAILAGLLLPVLGKARESARQIACISHLRNIYLALGMYVDASGGNYPYPVITADGTDSHINGYKMMAWPKYLFRYLSNTEIYFCPLDQKNEGRPKNPDSAPDYPVSYQYRYCLGYAAEDVINGSLKTGMFKYPSQQVIFHERAAWHGKRYVLNQINTPVDQYVQLNSLYVDGHARQWLMKCYDTVNKCYDANWFSGGTSPYNPRLGYDSNP